ncbi:MAG: hypothetical protein AAGJ94_17005 [Pseudomonadota bacterium]
MILLCYGITKSGSTLAFELAKGILAAAGHEQTQLPDGVVEPGRKINFINTITEERLEPLFAAAPGDKLIAVKTHAGFSRSLLPYLDSKVDAGALKVHAAYRDPREICLSLMDAGERARAKGRQAFSDVSSLDVAAENVARQMATFLRWASIKGTLHLNYNTTAFDMDNAVRTMASHLGVPVDAPAVSQTVTGGAFTQKNKAVQDRYKDELTVRQNEELYAKFRQFIENACVSQNQNWFARRRERILSQAQSDLSAA